MVSGSSEQPTRIAHKTVSGVFQRAAGGVARQGDDLDLAEIALELEGAQRPPTGGGEHRGDTDQCDRQRQGDVAKGPLADEDEDEPGDVRPREPPRRSGVHCHRFASMVLVASNRKK
jgi:hypothetical protein